MSATPTTRNDTPTVDDIERILGKVVARLKKSWRPILIVALLGGAAFFFLPALVAQYLQYLLYGLFMLFQLVFAVLFMIVQFVALFWFLARGRVYWIQPGESGVGFDDYKGNPEIIEASRRIVTLLRGVKEFKQMGGEVTRGVLLIGPPGTGKSYLAQVISTESGVPFGYMSAPSFQSMFMGIGNMKVMFLYNKARKLARKYGACILFIDEIDAIGGSRTNQQAGGMPMGALGGMFGGGGSGLLNELLNQMDPPRQDPGWSERILRRLGLRKTAYERPVVLTMGATNIPEVLDPALLRPGRFDRKISVDKPDFDGRKEVIEYYLNKVAHEDLSLDKLSYDTIGYSPAAMKFIVNEAVIQAHFSGRTKVSYQDFTRAREAHEWGLRHPIASMSVEDRRRLAYHEAGHAVAMYKLLRRSRLEKVTIIRHEGALGLAAPKPVQETYTQDKQEILSSIQISLASRASEELFLKTQLSGVTSDFTGATRMAAAYIGVLGMNGSLYSNLAFLDRPDGAMKLEIDKLLKEQYNKAKQLLSRESDLVISIAETLLQKQELDGDEVTALAGEVEERVSDGRPIHQLPATHGSPVSTLELLEKDRDGRLVASSVAAANMAKIDANGEKDREEEAAGSAPLNEPAPVSGAATSQMEAPEEK
jgi:cell division protease FtsH